ncbi:MAG: hypothetical protein BHW21_09380 [Eubacterium sp. 45_250]|nr:MAG: hypothetical protein BHW21_09380 [Eubacterium sp. 45_250]
MLDWLCVVQSLWHTRPASMPGENMGAGAPQPSLGLCPKPHQNIKGKRNSAIILNDSLFTGNIISRRTF